jgi:para-nitrobenzyl esterase
MLIGVPVPPVARDVSAQLQAAWTAFAADGDPGWPAYDDEQRRTRVFDVDGGVRPYPEEASRRLWEDHPVGVLDLLR